LFYDILLKNLVGMWDNISERAEMVYGKPSVVPRLTKPSDGWFTVPDTTVMIALEA
jgi:hypothetical protein